MRKCILLFLSGIALTLVSGCASNESYTGDPASLVPVQLFPLVDNREERSQINLFTLERPKDHSKTDYLSYQISGDSIAGVNLARRSNARLITTGIGKGPASITESEIASGAWVNHKELVTGATRYCICVCVDELCYSGGNLKARCAVKAFLLDRNTKSIVWQKSSSDSKFLGLVGGTVSRFSNLNDPDSPDNKLFTSALKDIFEDLPDLKKGA